MYGSRQSRRAFRVSAVSSLDRRKLELDRQSHRGRTVDSDQARAVVAAGAGGHLGLLDDSAKRTIADRAGRAGEVRQSVDERLVGFGPRGPAVLERFY